MQRLTTILGPTTSSAQQECLEPGRTRTYHLWGTFGVRFEFGYLDAWALSPQLTPDPGGLPAFVEVVPVRPGMTIAESDAALGLARILDPQSWLVTAADTGVEFSDLTGGWRRSISGAPQDGSATYGAFGPRMILTLNGNDPGTSLVESLVAFGAFEPEIAPQFDGCIASDIAF